MPVHDGRHVRGRTCRCRRRRRRRRRSRSRRSPQQGGEVRRAGLLLALDEELEVDRRGVPAGRGQRAAQAEQVEQHLALVVGGAAGEQLLAARRSARTAAIPTAPAGRPAARRGGRRRARWGVGLGGRPLGEHGRRARGRPRSRRSGTRLGGTPPPATRRWRRTSGACLGSALIDGIRSHVSRSACSDARLASTYSRSAVTPRSVMPASAPFARGRLASPSRRADRRVPGCGWRASTSSTAGPWPTARSTPNGSGRGRRWTRRARAAGGRPRPAPLAPARPDRRGGRGDGRRGPVRRGVVGTPGEKWRPARNDDPPAVPRTGSRWPAGCR